jgi:hypothetical protein
MSPVVLLESLPEGLEVFLDGVQRLLLRGRRVESARVTSLNAVNLIKRET